MCRFSNHYDRWGGKCLIRLLAVLLALAVAAPMLLAQEWDHWDHMNGRDKVHDPTGAWLIRTDIQIVTTPGVFFLVVFHKGGTLTQDVQGESAFDPSTVTLPSTDPLSVFNIITSPGSGVWQKTGWNTFATTLLAMQYHVQTNPPAAPLFRFDKAQYTGRLTESGDGMTFTARLTFFDVNGNQLNPDGSPGTEFISFNGNGVRIPLEVVPNTVHSLPIPEPPK